MVLMIAVAKYTCRSNQSYPYPRDGQMPLFPHNEGDDHLQTIVASATSPASGANPNGVGQANLLLTSFGGNELTGNYGSPYNYTGHTYRHRPVGTDSDLGYSSTVTPSSEMPPAVAARRATSPESGRASSPSVCSSTLVMKKKAGGAGGGSGGSVITTTAQIHSSDEGASSDLERRSGRKEWTSLGGGVGGVSSRLANTGDLIEVDKEAPSAPPPPQQQEVM